MGALPPAQAIDRLKWPLSLQETRDPAQRAFLWGVLPPGPYVAIVGRRQPTREAVACVRRLAAELAREGVTIVSGGALGIDTAAHRGALDVAGKTLVMAPVWFDKAYPAQNRPLFQEIIAQGGGYWTSAEAACAPLNPAFFRRNEALAAISQLLVVGEFAFRSGARNTVSHATRLGRPLFVLPSLYGNGGGAGSNALLNAGARAVLSSKDLLHQLERAGTYHNVAWWTSRGLARDKEVTRRVGPELEQPQVRATAQEGTTAPVVSGVLGAVAAGAKNVDEICVATGLAAPVVQHRLLLLTLSGDVSEDDRGLLRYHPAPHAGT